MGTFTSFTVAGYPLVETKSAVVPEIMTVFRETDRRVITEHHRDGITQPEDFEEGEAAILYVCDTDAAIDRLGVMGFTLNRVREEYEAGRQAEIDSYEELSIGSHDSWDRQQLELLDNLTFESYLEGLRYVIAEKYGRDPFGDHDTSELSIAARYIISQNDEYYFGFFSSDIRCLVRCACEVVPKPSKLIQDITGLTSGGYYGQDESVCQNSIDALTLGQVDNFKRIVLTEGLTDSKVLGQSLKLLYPHLCDYYSFIDFASSKAPGGAGQLVALAKGFAASGIGNKVIAIFDNDSAARDAMRSIQEAHLPSNITILKYPDIPELKSYPTIGPSGCSNLDVNGLAASIELYFGLDVLTQDDGEMVPVQWKGYIQSIRAYQGEVIGKNELLDAFSIKLSEVEANPNLRSQQDWSGIDAILQVIFQAFND